MFEFLHDETLTFPRWGSDLIRPLPITLFISSKTLTKVNEGLGDEKC